VSFTLVDPEGGTYARQRDASHDRGIELSSQAEYQVGNRGLSGESLKSVGRLPDEKTGNTSPDR
jgi:hypothetical protein